MVDTFKNVEQRTNPAQHHAAIVPSDSVNIMILPRGIYCQADGTAQVVDEAGTVLPYTMIQGQWLPVRAMRINATGTAGTFYAWY